jgi:hypothetical protein
MIDEHSWDLLDFPPCIKVLIRVEAFMKDRETCVQMAPGDVRAREDATLERRLFTEFLKEVTEDWQWNDDEPFRALRVDIAKMDLLLFAPAILLGYALAAEQGHCYQGLNGRENRISNALRCAILLVEKLPFAIRSRALQQQLPFQGEEFNGRSAVTAIGIALAIKDPRATSHFLGSEHVQAVLQEWWYEPSALAVSSRRSKDVSTSVFLGVIKTISHLGSFSYRPAKWRYEHQAAIAVGGNSASACRKAVENDQQGLSVGDVGKLFADIDELQSNHIDFLKYGRDPHGGGWSHLELLRLWLQSYSSFLRLPAARACMSVGSYVLFLCFFTYHLSFRHQNRHTSGTSGGINVSARPEWIEIYILIHFIGICFERWTQGIHQKRARSPGVQHIGDGDLTMKKARQLGLVFRPYIFTLDRIIFALVFMLVLTRSVAMGTGRACIGGGAACSTYNPQQAGAEDGFVELWGWPMPFESRAPGWMGVDLQGGHDCLLAILAVLAYARLLGIVAEEDQPAHAPFRESDRPTQEITEHPHKAMQHPFDVARAPEISDTPPRAPPLDMSVGRLIRVFQIILPSLRSMLCFAAIILVGFAASLQFLTSTGVAYTPLLPLDEEGFHTSMSVAESEKRRLDFTESFPQSISMLLYGALGFGGAEGPYNGPHHQPSTMLAGTAEAGNMDHSPGKPFSDATYLFLFGTAAVMCNAILLVMLQGLVISVFAQASAVAQKHVLRQWTMLCWKHDQHRVEPGLPPPLNLVVFVVSLILRLFLVSSVKEANEPVKVKTMAAGEELDSVMDAEPIVDREGETKRDWMCGYCMSSNSMHSKSLVVYINYVPDWHNDQADPLDLIRLNQPIHNLEIMTKEGDVYKPQTKLELLWWNKSREDAQRAEKTLSAKRSRRASASRMGQGLHLTQLGKLSSSNPNTEVTVEKLCRKLHAAHGSYCRCCQRSRRELLLREELAVTAEELVAGLFWTPCAIIAFAIAFVVGIPVALLNRIRLVCNYFLADIYTISRSVDTDDDDEFKNHRPMKRKPMPEIRRKELVATFKRQCWHREQQITAAAEAAREGNAETDLEKRQLRDLTTSVQDVKARVGHIKSLLESASKQAGADATGAKRGPDYQAKCTKSTSSYTKAESK